MGLGKHAEAGDGEVGRDRAEGGDGVDGLVSAQACSSCKDAAIEERRLPVLRLEEILATT